jgi:hypothetical protein
VGATWLASTAGSTSPAAAIARFLQDLLATRLGVPIQRSRDVVGGVDPAGGTRRRPSTPYATSCKVVGSALYPGVGWAD